MKDLELYFQINVSKSLYTDNSIRQSHFTTKLISFCGFKSGFKNKLSNLTHLLMLESDYNILPTQAAMHYF